MYSLNTCPNSQSTVSQRHFRPVRERVCAFLTSIVLSLALSVIAQNATAEVQFPDVGGTYKGMCTTPFNHIFCEDQSPLTRFKSCPDTLYVQQTGFREDGPNDVPTSFVSGQWLACNYYFPGRYVEEDNSCDPPVPSFSNAENNILREISTATYIFDAQLEWSSVFNAVSAATSMELVAPSAAASQRTYVAPAHAQTGTFFSFGIPNEPAIQSFFPTDWDDGTVYTVEDTFGIAQSGFGGCNAPAFKNIVDGRFLWYKVSNSAATFGHADLIGNLVSSVPSIADEVTRATIIVYSQPNGPIRSVPLADETAEEFDNYLFFNLSREASLEVMKDENGRFVPFDEAGRFEFKNLPTFKRSSRSGGRPLMREQLYAVEVINAKSDIVIDDGSGNLSTQFVSFDPVVVPNLKLADSPHTIELLPYAGPIPVKRSIADDLSAFCAAFSDAESEVFTYLASLENRGTALSPAEEEAIERAILAERAVLFSTKLADESFVELLDTVATLIGDVISDLEFGSNKHLSEAKEKYEKLRKEKIQNNPVLVNVSTEELESVMDARTRSQARRFKQGQFAGGFSNFVSVIGGEIESALVNDGLDPVEARRWKRFITKALKEIPQLFMQRDGFDIKGIVKEVTEEIIATVGDNAREELLCPLLADDLAYSAQQMKDWTGSNPEEFKKLRSEIYADLSLMSTVYSDVRADAIISKGAASGFDKAENVFGILSIGIKQAEIVEQGSKVAKYALNLRALIDDFGATTLALLTAENLVEKAYSVPGSTASKPSQQYAASVAAQFDEVSTISVPDLRPQIDTLTADIDSVISTLDGPSLEAAATAMFSGSDAFLNRLDEFQDTVDLILMEISGARTNQVNADNQIEKYLEWSEDYDFFSQNLNLTIAEYVDEMIAAAEAGGTTASYLRARDRLVSALRILQERINAVYFTARDLNDALPLVTAGSIMPAVHISLDSMTSNATGDDEITQVGETFTATATVRNLSDADLDNLSIDLLVSTGEDVTFETAATQLIPALSADGSGAGSSAQVTWELTYSGPISEKTVKLLYVHLLEDGGAPTSINANAAMDLWNVDPTVYDDDLDGLSNDFEIANGLDPAVPNENPDIDGDGIPNELELKLGTDLGMADTDGDGLDDFSEIYGAQTGYVTDPLNSDTDGDGVNDFADPAPIDAYADTPTQILNESPGVLQADQTSIVLSQADDYAGINITQSGDGELLWRAEVEDPGLFQLNVGPASAHRAPGILFVAARGANVDYSRAVTSRIKVVTVGQATNSEVWIDVMYEGAAGTGTSDTDGDGVSDDLDLCPNTPAGETVDANGCSSSQLDDDGDGVNNDADSCPNTPAGETVDANGCSQSQLDDDGDGVANAFDACPNTPAGASVDANGCSASQLDDDGDGVSNADDVCPNTPAGESVDASGCSQSQLDDDNDGVSNALDACPATPAGATVNADGCADSQLDTDGDGVNNSLDACPGTPAGTAVDGTGCPVSDTGGGSDSDDSGGSGGAGSTGFFFNALLILAILVSTRRKRLIERKISQA